MRIVAGVVMLMVVSACSERSPLAALPVDSAETRTVRSIEVSGAGVILGSPRTATFDLLVETWAPREDDAWRDIQVLTKRVSVGVRKAGVRGTDVYEHRVEIVPARKGELLPSPESAPAGAGVDESASETETDEGESAGADPLGDWSAYPPEAQGCIARQYLTVVHREPEKMSRAFANALRSGAARVVGLVLTPSNAEVLVERARQRAAQDAKARALVLAQELGMQLAQPIEIEEVSSSQPGDDPANPLEARVELRVLFSLRSS